jgi:subtilisin family serine protease
VANEDGGLNPLNLVKLTTLMERTSGSPDVKVGLIDGGVALQHPDLNSERFDKVLGQNGVSCGHADGAACRHGTFVAGILSARRNSQAPAICPDCTLVIRPIFTETSSGREEMPGAAPETLAQAIIECTNAGAQIINLSLGLARPSISGDQALEEALNYTVKHNVIVAAAAGNQGTLGSSEVTRHPWVIPVVACNLEGRPMNESNLGHSIGRRGLTAPGEGVTSLGVDGQPLTLVGTSVAVPFVTGTIVLMWSEFPAATAAQVKLALIQASTSRRASVVPPLLNAAAAYQSLSTLLAMR